MGTGNDAADRLGSSISMIGLPYFISTDLVSTFLEVNKMRKVAVIMGSDSDLPVVEKAINTLVEYGVPFEVHVYSAHRTPVEAKVFASEARANGFGAMIAAAGMAAHLAGAIAANTTLPVIGIPIASGGLGGLDAVLSTLQMPSGIPVATVAVNGAVNSALLAIEMLAITDKNLAKALDEKRQNDKNAVLEKNQAVEDKFNI
jgi:5-(carboxyamino)imidazole ribonucleotide mutase